MRARATTVIQNFKDEDVPGLLFYKEGGVLVNSLMGEKTKTAFGGKYMNIATVEYVLAKECNFLEVD